MKTVKCQHCGYMLTSKESKGGICFTCETINELLISTINFFSIMPNKRSVTKWADELSQHLIDP